MENIQTMKELAIEEAKNIKLFATDKEISNLDPEKFNPVVRRQCIYGQMTGSCDTDRSTELVIKCARKIYDIRKADSSIAEEAVLNGAPYSVISFRTSSYFSPIEMVILPEIGGKETGLKIISFLKGETETLEL